MYYLIVLTRNPSNWRTKYNTMLSYSTWDVVYSDASFGLQLQLVSTILISKPTFSLSLPLLKLLDQLFYGHYNIHKNIMVSTKYNRWIISYVQQFKFMIHNHSNLVKFTKCIYTYIHVKQT